MVACAARRDSTAWQTVCCSRCPAIWQTLRNGAIAGLRCCSGTCIHMLYARPKRRETIYKLHGTMCAFNLLKANNIRSFLLYLPNSFNTSSVSVSISPCAPTLYSYCASFVICIRFHTRYSSIHFYTVHIQTETNRNTRTHQTNLRDNHRANQTQQQQPAATVPKHTTTAIKTATHHLQFSTPFTTAQILQTNSPHLKRTG